MFYFILSFNYKPQSYTQTDTLILWPWSLNLCFRMFTLLTLKVFHLLSSLDSYRRLFGSYVYNVCLSIAWPST